MLNDRIFPVWPHRSIKGTAPGFFMNKFRKLGFIDYNGGIGVHSSSLNVVLHDQPPIKN